MSPQEGSNSSMSPHFTLKSTAEKRLGQNVFKEPLGANSSQNLAAYPNSWMHFLSNCTVMKSAAPSHVLGYATAAERVSVFLGPLFVRSQIDDITTI